VLILRAAGTNCDEETEWAWSLAGAAAERVHINRLIERPALLGEYEVLTIPGGFSYGDDIASGKILANQIQLRLGDAVRGLIDRGGLVIGICNGFQALVKAGLLPGPGLPPATLTFNDSGRFEARWVHVRAGRSRCPLFEAGEMLRLPVAHGEGKVMLGEPAGADGEGAIAVLETAGCVALRYAAPGRDRVSYPENPNGSESDIAGLCDPTGRVVGLMPHPERCISHVQRPEWTRDRSVESDGLRFFRRAVASFQR
jgi:phosphoribosylformylglycinamidine synthase I